MICKFKFIRQLSEKYPDFIELERKLYIKHNILITLKHYENEINFAREFISFYENCSFLEEHEKNYLIDLERENINCLNRQYYFHLQRYERHMSDGKS